MSLAKCVPIEYCSEMRLVPGGDYQIGVDSYTRSTALDVPVVKDRLLGSSGRTVKVEPFYISEFPVTNKEFETIFPFHRRSRYTPDDAHPVVDITYYEALGYCQEKDVRLPTEIEWEAAARGKLNLPLSNGPEFNHDFCNYYPSQGPNLPGAYPPNDLGIYDMAGNICELTSTEVPLGEGRFVVIGKGGSWGTCRYAALASYFLYVDPGFRSNRVGFRVCVDCKPEDYASSNN
jgi:formylglycine-generating enzyme required for sulfatase activity